MTDMNKIRNEAIELINSGKNKGQIEGFLKYMHDMSTKEAKLMAAQAFEECGLSPNTYGQADHKETVEYIRNNYGKISKKQLIEGMCETNGKTYLTNQHAYNYIAMMQEYARQEVEANS